MVQILLFLANHCAFLFRPDYFRFVDSRVDESFGNAFVVLESSVIRLRLVRNRSRLAGEFQPVEAGRRDSWYTLDLLRGVLHGDRSGPYALDAAWARFLAASLPDLEDRFASEERRDHTLKELAEQGRLRAKERFG